MGECECDMTPVPGVIWPIASGGDGTFPFVERCDMCKRYDDDEAAAFALVKFLATVGLDDAMVVRVLDKPRADSTWLVAVFPSATGVRGSGVEPDWQLRVDSALSSLRNTRR